MAHYSLGYTLYELGRYRGAYRHLRAYTELVSVDGWAWCWLGKACEAMGDKEEARSTYSKAIELDGDHTDAPELLIASLDRRLREGAPDASDLGLGKMHGPPSLRFIGETPDLLITSLLLSHSTQVEDRLHERKSPEARFEMHCELI